MYHAETYKCAMQLGLKQHATCSCVAVGLVSGNTNFTILTGRFSLRENLQHDLPQC